MRGTIAVVCLVLLVAACSGGSSGPPDPHHLAAKLGCTYHREPSTELFTRTTGHCGSWTIYTFGTSDAQDNYLTAAAHFGGNYAAGDGWVVSVDYPRQAARVAKTLGGHVVG